MTDSITTRIVHLIEGCELHGHEPTGIEIQQSHYRSLVSEIIRPKENCWDVTGKCGHEECERYRKALTQGPGEAGEFFGVKLTVVPDVPQIRLLHEEVA